MTEQYIGKTIGVKKGKQTLPASSYRPECIYTTYEIEKSDPVFTELEAAYPRLRVWLPDTFGTCDLNMSRMNVYVEETSPDVFTIVRMGWG